MKITQVYKRNGKVVPFNQQKIIDAVYKAIVGTGGHDMNLARQIASQVVVVLEKHFPKTTPSIEEIQDIIEQILVDKGHTKIAKHYILYRQKRKEVREKKEKKEIENIPYHTIWSALVWNLEHSCETIDKLNKHIVDGTFTQLVKDSEDNYQRKISQVISLMKERLDKLKLLIIAGPSSSGKTTTANYLIKALEKQGYSFLKINIDNYFYDLKTQLRDNLGDYDFEGPYALNIPLINQHLLQLLAGKVIQIPLYNFKTGQQEPTTNKAQLKPNQIILIDSHYGLYETLTDHIPNVAKFSVYLETLCQIKDNTGRFVRWTMVRMLRRMIRDKQFRSYQPAQTVAHWHYVRKGELKNIIPYLAQADYVFNTALPYELPILKHYLFSYLPAIIKTYQHDKQREDAHIRAKQTYQLLQQITEWPDPSIVPRHSILREFIGPK